MFADSVAENDEFQFRNAERHVFKHFSPPRYLTLINRRVRWRAVTHLWPAVALGVSRRAIVNNRRRPSMQLLNPLAAGGLGNFIFSLICLC